MSEEEDETLFMDG